MEERQNIFDMANRRRKNCRICGEGIGYEESVYTDGYTTVHMECHFDFLANGGGDRCHDLRPA